MNKAQKHEAQSIMKHNKVNKLFMTSDGQFFLVENSANNHAKKEHGNPRKKNLGLTKVTEDMLIDKEQIKADAKIKADADAKTEANSKTSKK